jgi:hypothetical protein
MVSIFLDDYCFNYKDLFDDSIDLLYDSIDLCDILIDFIYH